MSKIIKKIDVLLILILISLYGKFGFFFNDSLISPSYTLSVVIILITMRHLLCENRVKICAIFLLLVSFISFLLANRDVAIYYSQILLVLSFFTLHKVSLNTYNLIGIICIIIFEIIYFVITCLIDNSHGVMNILFRETFDNPIGFVCLLLCCVPIILPYYSVARRKVMSMLLIIFIVICLSESRIGLLAFLFILLYHFYNSSNRLRYCIEKFKYLFIISTVLLFAILFIIKYDSSSGRLLIWYTVFDIIKSNTILGIGIGIGEFKRIYMAHQSSILSGANNEYWNYLANNISHPFSEYFLIYTELGIISIVVVFYVLKWTLKCKNQYSEIILVIFVCSLVSYPLTYPYIWVILGFALSHVIPPKINRSIKNSKYIQAAMILLLSTWLGLLIYDINCNCKWRNIINEESSENKYLLYSELYQLRIMKKNPYFLYDFGTYLSNENKLDLGTVVLTEASQLIQDYNLELSLGDIYDKKGDYLLAERHYLAAGRMCPNRFTPFFFLFKMYDKMEMNEKAIHMAHFINEKKIKVNSVSVNYIKSEVRKYISENDKKINNE